MKTMMMADVERVRTMSTEELRGTFLVENLFGRGQITTIYVDVDRTIVGSAVPTIAALTLGDGGVNEELRAAYFLERRELGVLNIGAKGSVTVDDQVYEMENLDCLYVGRGSRELKFASADPDKPAQFYLLSYPAHTTYPTALAKKSQAAAVPLGSQETLNKRTIYKYIHMEGIKSCQLVMGFTVLEQGSGWNTMPPHTHTRRSEVYLYFNVPEKGRVFHFMGQPSETKHLVVADKNLVISPAWSIHCGVGTAAYMFCWGMGGENQAFDDMDAAPIVSLR